MTVLKPLARWQAKLQLLQKIWQMQLRPTWQEEQPRPPRQQQRQLMTVLKPLARWQAKQQSPQKIWQKLPKST